jgi:hypothetical protein
LKRRDFGRRLVELQNGSAGAPPPPSTDAPADADELAQAPAPPVVAVVNAGRRYEAHSADGQKFAGKRFKSKLARRLARAEARRNDSRIDRALRPVRHAKKFGSGTTK